MASATRGPGLSPVGTVAAAVALAGVGAVWVAGAVGARVSGAALPGNPVAYVILLARGRVVWPGMVSTVVLLGLGIVLVAVAAVLVVWWARGSGWRAVRDQARFMAQPRDMEGLIRRGAQKRARRLRPSLPESGRLDPGAVGVTLGRLMPRAVAVSAAFEDVVVAVMAARSGKTTALAVPMILDAPGAVVVTSNKADVVNLTAQLRAGSGRVWRFDSQGVTRTDQQMWWNPLAGVATIADARLLASHFLQEVAAGGSDTDFWSRAGLRILATLLLAAAVSGGTLNDVWRWINTPADSEPVRRLFDAGLTASAAGLEGTRSGAIETREGLYETVRSACACLEDSRIMTWVTPPPDRDGQAPQGNRQSAAPRAGGGGTAGIGGAAGAAGNGDDDDAVWIGTDPEGESAAHRVEEVTEFDPRAFVRSRDTIYLLSTSDVGAAQPLVAALADAVFRSGIREAEGNANLRLDPPLLCVLDEAANVCKIRNLPELYSHLGSRSIVPITVLQSYKQAEMVWGATGAQVLWSAATVKVIGAGIDDPRLAEDLSRLVGEYEVRTRSVSAGGRRQGRSMTTAVSVERILSAADVRNIPKGWALLFATGCRAGMIRLEPWYSSARRVEIAAANSAAEVVLRRAAQ